MPIQASWLNLALQPEMTGEETTETAGEGTKDTSTDTKGTREGGDWLRSLLSAIGPAVGLITAVIVRVRNRRGTLSEVTERIPIALAIDIPLSTEGESRNPTQRRTRQRRRVRWRSILLLFYSLYVVLLPALWRYFTQGTLKPSRLLDSYGDLIGGLIHTYFTAIFGLGTVGLILGMVGYVAAGLFFVLGYTYFFLFLVAHFRAWSRLRRAPIDRPSEWCKQTEITVDGPCDNSSVLIPFRDVLRALGSTITEVNLEQNHIKARQGGRLLYDDVSLHMEQRSGDRCLVRVMVDGIRPTLDDDADRHLSYLRRFSLLVMG